MTLDTELETCMAKLPGCVRAGYVDLESGFMLGVKSETQISEDDRQLLAVAAVQALASPAAIEMGEALGRAAGGESTDTASLFGEVVVMGKETLHVLQRIETYPEHALCLVFRSDIPTDEALSAARGCLKRFSDIGLH